LREKYTQIAKSRVPNALEVTAELVNRTSPIPGTAVPERVRLGAVVVSTGHFGGSEYSLDAAEFFDFLSERVPDQKFPN
jgi:hypothetical protein